MGPFVRAGGGSQERARPVAVAAAAQELGNHRCGANALFMFPPLSSSLLFRFAASNTLALFFGDMPRAHRQPFPKTLAGVLAHQSTVTSLSLILGLTQGHILLI